MHKSVRRFACVYLVKCNKLPCLILLLTCLQIGWTAFDFAINPSHGIPSGCKELLVNLLQQYDVIQAQTTQVGI